MNDLFADESVEPLQLRSHQNTAIDQIRSSFMAKSVKRTVLQASTGFGKTLTASKIIQQALSKGGRVLFTVPRITLVDQAAKDFERQGINHIGIIQAKHPRVDPKAPVQIASMATLAVRGIDFDPTLIIVDECHIGSKQTVKLIEQFPDVHFIGLSATPWAKGLGLIWQDVKIPITMGELIKQGYLSKFRVFAPYSPDVSDFKKVNGDFREKDIEFAMNNKKIVADVVKTWKEKGEGRPTLVFGVNIKHAQALQKEFLDAGVTAGYCDAYTDRVAMQVYADRFERGEYEVFCSVRKLTTGVDWAVSCIVDAAPTASEMLHVQKIGRGLRVNDGTEDCLILDHAGNSLRLGMVTDISHEVLDKSGPKKKREKPKAEKLPKECSNCAALHSGLICPFCGNVIRLKRQGVEIVDGELVELKQKKKGPVTMQDKQRFWCMALHVDRHRNKGGRFAKAMYREKFGVWPKGLADISMKPDAEFMSYERSRRIAYAKRINKKSAST